MKRICKICKIEKEIDRFPVANIYNDKKYYKYTCYNCISIKTRILHWKTRGIDCDWDLFLDKLKEQNYKCAICHKVVLPYQENKKNCNSACLDHDHKNNKPRGILCETCNRAIGLLQDNINYAKNSYYYLLKWKPSKKK